MSSQDCQMCKTADETSWWGQDGLTHCRGCHRSWKRDSVQAHCVTCHRHFSRPTGFDEHFDKEGTHIDPRHKGGTYEQDEEGVWKKLMSEDAREYFRSLSVAPVEG